VRIIAQKYRPLESWLFAPARIGRKIGGCLWLLN